MKKVVIFGLGLLGGSMALELKKYFSSKIIGIDNNENHLQKALSLNIIDTAGKLSDASDADLVLIAVPVNHIADILIDVLDMIDSNAFVFDVGSTKYSICQRVKSHPKRQQYVAMHPIAGTEFSGPVAACYDLFKNKVNIICDKEKTSQKNIEKIQKISATLQMRTIFMDSKEHDKHIAYVSHLSHISSFMLGKTVLELETNRQNVFDMAGSGFESTVRLAKSSAKTWSAIFVQNKENVLKSLDDYIENLKLFRKHIFLKDIESLEEIMKNTNYIRKVLEGIENK